MAISYVKSIANYHPTPEEITAGLLAMGIKESDDKTLRNKSKLVRAIFQAMLKEHAKTLMSTPAQKPQG
jgi:hypothetical protein